MPLRELLPGGALPSGSSPVLPHCFSALVWLPPSHARATVREQSPGPRPETATMPGHVTASWSSVADCSGPTRATWPERACECGEGRAGPGRPAGSTPHTGSCNARRGGRRARACGGERLVLGRIRAARVFSLLALCLLFSGAGGESGSQDGIRGGAGPDNDTSYPSGREGLRSYPASIHSGRMRRQTVDDLVYNHFLIHSAGGSGRWGGGVAGRGEGDGAPNPWTFKGENAGCDDTIASLSAELFDESNISSTTPQTSASKPAVGCRLWRSRYLMAVESFVSDDGQTAIRLARDYQADGSTKDALRLIKFMRCEHEFGRHWARLQHVYRAFPHLVAQPVEAFEASPDEVDGSLGTFVIVMQGGQPLSHVIAQQDKGDGIERALAVRILQDVEAAVVSLSAAGYAPDELSVRHIMLRSGRAIFLDPPVSVSPHHVDASGGNSPHLSSASQSHALAALESPLCLPEQSFAVGEHTKDVWAFKNLVYLMVPRPGNSLFACQRIEDDSLHRASVTLQTSRLYLLQIRVRPGAAWLPDNSEPYRVHASEPPGEALAESSDEETVYL